MNDKAIPDNVVRLAHLLNQKYMNISLYEDKKIPTYMYEQVNEQLCKKIDELEKACYAKAAGTIYKPAEVFEFSISRRCRT